MIAKIETILSKKLNKAVVLIQVLNKEIKAGYKIFFKDRLIDCSLKNKIELFKKHSMS